MRVSGQAGAAVEYAPRRPETTTLYGTVQHHLEAWLRNARARERTVPHFVERELRAFLDCGILANGFLRVHCDACALDRVVPFSCKGRGFCPSCGGRHMADTAAHLVDRTLPRVPVRQWVLSLPFGLRYRLAYDRELTAEVLRVFVRAAQVPAALMEGHLTSTSVFTRWSSTAPTANRRTTESFGSTRPRRRNRYADAANRSIWVPDCWWGTDDLQAIHNRIFDQQDSSSSPVVHIRAFGDDCSIALGLDQDNDGEGDFEDNCPIVSNASQTDSDGDEMGDACDPQVGVAPTGLCDGFTDTGDGYVDSDGDGWGDPCDFQPTRSDSYPGAPELCDARDNDGDTLFGLDELGDADGDLAITCSDCADDDPAVFPCACEQCTNGIDDDCNTFMDGADVACADTMNCVIVTAGVEPEVTLEKGACVGASVSGPFDIIRGKLERTQVVGSSLDLGAVSCLGGGLPWDRVEDVSINPTRTCNEAITVYLVRNAGDTDFGATTNGELRDTMSPDPPCP